MTQIRKVVLDEEICERLSVFLGMVFPDDPRRSGAELNWFWNRITRLGPIGAWVIEDDGELKAFARVCDAWWNDLGETVVVLLAVHPDSRRKGFGTRLLKQCMGVFESTSRKTVHILSREGDVAGQAFLSAHGFGLLGRFNESAADTQKDVPEFALERLEQVLASGIEIIDGHALARRLPDDWKEHWWHLQEEARADMPGPDPSTPRPFEQFLEFLDMPGLDLSLIHFAIDGETLVADTGIKIFEEDPRFGDILMTGVARSHRRRGLATAIKTHSLMAARAANIRWVLTENEETNQTWQINMSLGFEPRPVKLLYSRDFAELKSRLVLESEAT